VFWFLLGDVDGHGHFQDDFLFDIDRDLSQDYPSAGLQLCFESVYLSLLQLELIF
jgi:hypothetical protein